MDGYAVRAKDLSTTHSDSLTVIGVVAAGQSPSQQDSTGSMQRAHHRKLPFLLVPMLY